MTSLTVTANGTDVTTYVDMSTLAGQNDLTQRIDTLSFDLIHAPLSAVDDKMDVVVTDQAGTRWFGGIVGSVERDSETKDKRARCQVQGFGALLDTALANKVYNTTTDVAIIADLLSTYRSEITPAATSISTPVDHIAFAYRTLSNCLDTICALTGNRYYVDPNKALYYLNPQALTPVLTLTDTNPDNVTTWSYEEWSLRSDATQIQNRITAIGGTFLAPSVTDSFTGDGSTTTFTLAHRPNNTTAVSVGGALQSYGHRGIDDYGGPLSIVALVDDAQQQVVFQTAPAGAASVQISYDFYTPIIARAQSQPSFARYGRWYDGKVMDGGLLSVQTAVARASSVLSQYAFAPRTVQLRTRAPWTRSGQAVTLTNTPDGVTNQRFLIQQTRWRPVGNGVVVQDMQLIG